MTPLAAAPHPIPSGVTLLFGVLLALLVICLALEEKLHARKSLIAGIAAVAVLFLGDLLAILPVGPVVNVFGEKLELPVYVPAIDWGVIAIILGSSMFVDVASRSGIFTWAAIRLTKASKGDPRRLLWFYGVMTVVFSAFLNNVTAMIIVGSLTSVSLKRLGRTDQLLGFLLLEGLLTNVGGLVTLISSVPNIIVGTAAGFSFVRFFVVAAPFVAVATVVTILLGIRLFDVRGLASDAEREEAERQVAGFDENDGISSPAFFWFSGAMIVAFIATIATTTMLPVIKDLGMGYVAMLFALIMLCCYKSAVDEFYQAIDWDLLGFFAGLFIVINVMEHAGVLAVLGGGIAALVDLGPRLGAAAMTVSCAALSSVTDNIPLAAMLASILKGMSAAPPDGMWWAVVFGANLGGNLTPIGSASTLVAVTIIHKNGIPLGFVSFVKLALPLALAQILLAVAYVVVFV